MQSCKPIAEAERSLRQAQGILEGSCSYEPEEWMLLATLIGEADLTLRHDQSSPELGLLLSEVVADFREVTRGFTHPEFIRATKSARRRNPQLFAAAPQGRGG